MASKTAVKRLNIEYRAMQESPTPYIDARPSDADILQWYYVITGPPDTPFAGGQYLGELKFPANYPFSPPSIRMLTPSGRFEPGSKLCLNMSDYHPETWNPAWNISTILTGLLSFMCSNEVATGAIQNPPAKQREFTKRSVKWNLKNPTFCQMFPDTVAEIRAAVPDADAVSTIEVVPPKASDLVANMAQYRATAYQEAAERAKSVGRPAPDPQAAAGSSGGVSLGPIGLVVLVTVTVAVAAGALAFLR